MLKMIDGILVIERDDCLSSLHNKESDLQHNILFNITANINHEVNSPLLVIKSVIEEMLLELDDMYVQVDKCSGRRECEAMVEFKRNMDELMSLANESVISIDSAIRPLSDYKSIKFTNGDRNVYMLVDIATKMLRRTNITTFKTIIIDNELKKYSIMHDDGLTNGFFLNLMINHVKNSLEAKSSRLEVTLHDRDETHLYIYVTDNGNGVAPEMIPGLYEPNVTSKANIEEYRRGVGLYLSKLLITKKYGGDDTFISSTPNVATTFCIKVRYEDFKFYKEDIDEENTI
jgi:signal transduction histidine kinase